MIIAAFAYASHVPPTATLAPTLAKISVGQRAPEFAVTTSAGPFNLAHDAGKPTLLEVFATWCPHCQHETATLNALYRQFAGRVNLEAVSGNAAGMDGVSPETEADVAAFAQRFSVAYPVAFDPTLGVAKTYLQGGYPTLVLIGADGRIQSINSGEIPEASLAGALDASLAGRTPNPTFGQPRAS